MNYSTDSWPMGDVQTPVHETDPDWWDAVNGSSCAAMKDKSGDPAMVELRIRAPRLAQPLRHAIKIYAGVYAADDLSAWTYTDVNEWHVTVTVEIVPGAPDWTSARVDAAPVEVYDGDGPDGARWVPWDDSGMVKQWSSSQDSYWDKKVITAGREVEIFVRVADQCAWPGSHSPSPSPVSVSVSVLSMSLSVSPRALALP
jgi:hypothetical protein